MVNVVDLAFTITKINQNLDGIHDVFIREHHRAFHLATTQTTIDLHAANAW